METLAANTSVLTTTASLSRSGGDLVIHLAAMATIRIPCPEAERPTALQLTFGLPVPSPIAAND